MKNKITPLSVIKQFRNIVYNQGYFLFILFFTAIGMAAIFLGYTEFSFLGTLIQILVLLPLIFVFAQYFALINMGFTPPRGFKAQFAAYRFSFRSGKLQNFISLRKILLFILYLVIMTLVVNGALVVYIRVTDQTTFSAFMDIFNQIVGSTSIEESTQLSNQLMNFLTPYQDFMTLSTILIINSGIAVLITNGLIDTYFDGLIQRQQVTTLKAMKAKLFNDETSKKQINISRICVVSFIMLLGGVTTIGGYFLFRLIPNNQRVFLQVELLSFLAMMSVSLFIVSYIFYFSQSLINNNKPRVLEFSISELKTTLSTAKMDDAMRKYFEKVIEQLEKEYASLSQNQNE